MVPPNHTAINAAFLAVGHDEANQGKYEGANRWVHLINKQGDAEEVNEKQFNSMMNKTATHNQPLANCTDASHDGLIIMAVTGKRIDLPNGSKSKKNFYLVTGDKAEAEHVDRQSQEFWGHRYECGNKSDDERKNDDREQRRLSRGRPSPTQRTKRTTSATASTTRKRARKVSISETPGEPTDAPNVRTTTATPINRNLFADGQDTPSILNNNQGVDGSQQNANNLPPATPTPSDEDRAWNDPGNQKLVAFAKKLKLKPDTGFTGEGFEEAIIDLARSINAIASPIAKSTPVRKKVREHQRQEMSDDNKRKDQVMHDGMQCPPPSEEMAPHLSGFGNAQYQSPTAMANLITSIITCGEEVPQSLRLENFHSRGLGKQLVMVQPANQTKAFKQRAHKWMRDIIATCVRMSDMKKQAVVSAMIQVLGEIDSAALDDFVSNKLKLNQITVYGQMAMFDESKTGCRGQRMIRRHLRQQGYDILQPECVVRGVQAEHLDPTFIECYEGLRKKTAWYIPIDEQIMFCLNERADLLCDNRTKIKALHLNFSGDHGQGAFRFIVRVLLFITGKESPLIDETYIVGWMSCKKDTRQVLMDSIMPMLNDSMEKPCTIGGIAVSKTRPTEKEPKGLASVDWWSGDAVNSTKHTYSLRIPFEMFLAGDTAFLATMQGRDDMSPHWCMWCILKKAQWQALNQPSARPVTLEWLQRQIADLESGKLKRDNVDDKKGCKHSPILTNINCRNVLVGVLHCVDLHVNTIFKLIFEWALWRIENAPDEILEKRQVLAAAAALEEQQATSELEDCIECLAEKEAELKVPKDANKEIRSKRKKTDEDKRIVDEWNADKQQLVDEIKTIKAEKKRLTDDESKAKSAHTKANKSLKDCMKRKEHGAMTQQRRQDLEHMLETQFQMVRSSHHGGDLEGNQCRGLARSSDEAMDGVISFLKETPAEDRKADDEEIDRFLNGIKILLQCMDCMMHHCCQPCDALTDEQTSEASRINLVCQQVFRIVCNSAPPKTHSWFHLPENLKKLRGLRHHNESPCEAEHQIGKQMERRFSMRDSKKSVISQLRARADQRMPEVQAKKDEAKEKSKRKLTKQKQPRQQRERRGIEDLEKDVELFKEKIPSVKELNAKEFLQKKMAAATEKES